MGGLPTSGPLTFLFTDIEGSTRKAHELGDDWIAVLELHHSLLRPVFTDHGGLEVSTAGDSFFVVFEDAADAVLASVAMQRAIAAHDWSPHSQVKVRMGVHTGFARFRPHDQDYAGLAVHAAARVESAAAGGQVLITEATLDRAGSTWPESVDTLDLGLHRLKDMPTELRLYQLVAQGLQREFPPVRSIDVVRNNVPLPVSTFVGRTEVLAHLHRLLDDERLVSIVGSGGTGKTSVALRLANERLHRHADGVWLIELAPTTNRVGVVNAVAHALGVGEAPGADLLAAVCQHVRGQDVLLVIDNCEHVIDDAAVVVERLLTTGAGVRVLTTSQESLDVGGERTFPLAPLSTDDGGEAVALLVERIKRVRPSFELDDRLRTYATTIARRLDGLPLAIELAAASAATVPLEQIAAQLKDRFTLLTHGARNAAARHKTLRGAIDWSYGLLTGDEQTLFRRLAVFPAEFDFGVARAICGDGLQSPDDALSALIRKSLVTEASTTRLRFLESVRLYARARLEQAGELDALLATHARYFVDAIERTNFAQSEWIDMVHEDFAAALAWGRDYDRDVQLRALAELQGFWHRKGHLSEGRAVTDAIVASVSDEEIGKRHSVLTNGAAIALSQGDLTGAKTMFLRAATIGERIDGPDAAQLLLGNIGKILQREGDLDGAEAYFERSLAAARRAGSDHYIATTLALLANLVTQRGDLARARDLTLEAVERARTVEWNELHLSLTTMLGVIARHLGELGDARRILGDALTMAEKADDTEGAIYVLYCLAAVELDDANPAGAKPYLRGAIETSHANGALPDLAESVEATARLAAADQPALAASLLATADQLRSELTFERQPIDVPAYEALLDQLAGHRRDPLSLDAAVAAAMAILAD